MTSFACFAHVQCPLVRPSFPCVSVPSQPTCSFLSSQVLLGIIFMPFMTMMKWLSTKFNNVNLDPQVWIDAAGEAYNHMCKNNPAGFVGTDLSFFVVRLKRQMSRTSPHYAARCFAMLTTPGVQTLSVCKGNGCPRPF
jgi:hypothetical protein